MSAILTATDLEVRHNELVVLDRASLAIEENGRVGMVGRNGCGKSTFLKIIAGQINPDAGEVVRRRDLVVGYLPQEFALDPNLTVEGNVRTGAKQVLDLIHEFESLPADSKKHAELEEHILRLDGWGIDRHIQTAMAHLSCPAADRQISTLSGGEKRRVALCRAIIAQPDLLILDEPTNHLDTESIEWLGEFLLNYRGAFLMVTHDRYFLDRITNSIVELANGRFYSYTGNYTDYLEAKTQRQAAEESIENARQTFLKRELVWVRSGVQARRTKKKDRFERYYEIAAQSGPNVESDIELVIPPPPQLGNRVVELTNVAVDLGAQRLFSNLNLEFKAGDRIGITGRNGLGKTTLLKVVLGELKPTEGTVKIGQLTQYNYVDQGRLQLRDDRTVLEEISDGTEFVVFGDETLSLRAYLKRFLFTDDRISTQVKYLSGGERSRLLLARILKNGGNFLVLDEPTNDLDLPTLRILEEALVAFPGVVLVVSHDRYFLNRVCTGILAFEGQGKVNYSVGDYDYYLEKRVRTAVPQPAEPKISKAAEPTEPKKQPSSRPRKLSFKEQRELDGMEAAVLAAEENAARIEALFVDPDFHRKYGQRIDELQAELAAEKERIAKLYERWQELEAIRTASSANPVS
ncbi:MAG: ABC-F family ATP-binding cassette domain-containing protein [Limisphaerales bacterium]